MTQTADRLTDRCFHAFAKSFCRRTFLPCQHKKGLATFRAHRLQLLLAAHRCDPAITGYIQSPNTTVSADVAKKAQAAGYKGYFGAQDGEEFKTAFYQIVNSLQ